MNSISKSFLIFTTIICILLTSTLFSQSSIKKNSFGISALVQDSQFDILLPYVFEGSVSLAPAIGFSYASEIGSDISLGFVSRFYLNDNSVKPFLGGRAGVIIFSPSKDKNSQTDPLTTTDVVLGLLGGGEYFLNDGFSFGVEAQLNVAVSDENSSRFGNPGGVNVNTGAAVFATVYF